jgi:acetyl-CoA carboxylase carboxyl transferase subunit alpha
LTASDLSDLGLVDVVVPEPTGGAHNDPRVTIKRVMHEVQLALRELIGLDADALVDARRKKYLKMGSYTVVKSK